MRLITATDCPACATATAVYGMVSGHPVRRCPACGHGCLGPTADDDPDFPYTESYYRNDTGRYGYPDYLAEATSHRLTARQRLRRLRPLSPPSAGPLLEIGCAHGFFLAAAREHGYSVEGHDRSATAVDWAKREFGLPCHQSRPDQEGWRPIGECFGTAVLWDTIEHLDAPLTCLHNIARTLVPYGRIWLTTGDWGSLAARWRGPAWRLLKPPEHRHFFTRTSMRLMLAAAGFRLESIRCPLTWYTLAHVGARLGWKSGGPEWARRVPVPITLFDIVEVHAVLAP